MSSEESNYRNEGIVAPGLIFGIYPGGPTLTEADVWEGPPNDPAKIDAALDELQQGRPFLVRSYVQYLGAERLGFETPPDYARYAHSGRLLDLVLCYRIPDGNLQDWTRFIRDTVQRYGPLLGKLQITEEPNSHLRDGDGNTPNVLPAIVEGILVAKEEAQRGNYAFQVGFNATPIFSPKDDFWPGIGAAAMPSFLAALDYVGLDFFPDVFRPLASDGSIDKLGEAVRWVIGHFRQVNLATGQIPPTIPIHICENGWPTGPNRPYERQVAVLETIVRTVYGLRAELNISHYEHFDLRDAASTNPTLGYEFGLLRDDYTPKPAFARYRELIAELSL